MKLGLFIDGESRAAHKGGTFSSINPATEEPWAEVASATAEDVDAAVAAARRAQPAWRKRPREERAQILAAIAAAILENSDQLAAAEVQDSGGTIRKANMADVPATAQTFQYYSDLLAQTPDEEVFSEDVPVPSKNIVRREPLGVCACITPFNFPMAAASWKIAPAIAAGNAIVVKPSPYTPVTTLMLGEICHRAGVPAGVVNVLAAPGPEIGERLVTHPGVDKIAFTGSTAVGRRIMELAAPEVRKLTLELGGKSPNIVLEDANLESAVRGALFGTFFHAGQVCESGTRLLVHEKIHDAFIERMIAAARQIKVGDPMDFASTMGPLISERQLANTEKYVAAGRKSATLVFGGKRLQQKGWYHEPTIFIGVNNDMPIAREEIFGPVVSVLKFSTEDEALRIANDTIYGLGAAVWSSDLERAQRMAERIDAGTVWINDYHLINVRFPFGGYKQSGFGRELGPWGLAEYQQLKHIHVGQSSGPDEKPYFSLIFE